MRKESHVYNSLLDAEAWTDAAMMLIPDNWTAWEMRSHAARSHFSADLSRLSECDAGQEDWAHGGGMHPALALAEAALRALASDALLDRQGE